MTTPTTENAEALMERVRDHLTRGSMRPGDYELGCAVIDKLRAQQARLDAAGLDAATVERPYPDCLGCGVSFMMRHKKDCPVMQANFRSANPEAREGTG